MSRTDPASDLREAEAIASEILIRGGISRPPVPANLIGVFDPERPVHVVKRPLRFPVRGLLQPGKRCWLVILASYLPPPAQRFTLFHEGYHILCRCRAVRLDGPKGYEDWLADGFAARLLMPRQWVVERISKVNVGQLAFTFRVSRRAMERRIKELERWG